MNKLLIKIADAINEEIMSYVLIEQPDEVTINLILSDEELKDFEIIKYEFSDCFSWGVTRNNLTMTYKVDMTELEITIID